MRFFIDSETERVRNDVCFKVIVMLNLFQHLLFMDSETSSE